MIYYTDPVSFHPRGAVCHHRRVPGRFPAGITSPVGVMMTGQPLQVTCCIAGGDPAGVMLGLGFRPEHVRSPPAALAQS
jgi:hypothetical protein